MTGQVLAGLEFAGQRLQLCLQRGNPGAGAVQHCSLGIELLPVHDIQPAQCRLRERAHGLVGLVPEAGFTHQLVELVQHIIQRGWFQYHRKYLQCHR